MSELGTIRERIQRASSYFREHEGVVLTTFNLSATFLEEQALPAVYNVEAQTTAARRAELHQRLGVTPCTVYYDPTIAPRISGRYLYVAYPVPVRNRFFHPKLVIIAGRSEDQTTWVYLAVSSANLTMSGWGRNAEAFGETWIYTKRQQSWRALDDFLAWLQLYAPLGEKKTGSDATTRIRAALSRMPNRRRFTDDGTQPWSGSTYARLYSSVINAEGLPKFLQFKRTRRSSELWAYSPYWSEVSQLVGAFNARKTVLVPAWRSDFRALSLSQDQAKNLPDKVQIQRNSEDTGSRFWHMKMYKVIHGETVYTAVGSCNFTAAGLSGKKGNVEAMLVFEHDPDWLPSGEEATVENFIEESLFEEDVPEPAPVAIVVAWDWRESKWRWWLEAGPRQQDFLLRLPGFDPSPIASGTDSRPGGKPPSRGATFMVDYKVNGKEQKPWEGQVVELNLDHSSRVYGRPLTASEILENWRGRAVTWDIRGGRENVDPSEDIDDIEGDVPAAFDAVNLYDLYLSMKGLRDKLTSLGAHQDLQRPLIVGRPDSVMALAHLADRDEEVPVVRYLVLRELYGIISDWAHLLDADLVSRVKQMSDSARERSRELLLQETKSGIEKADEILDWFEHQLEELGKRGKQNAAVH